ncbi:hypothetical protein [Actinoplanes couchii]|uniref:DUF5753 domain-containing protein n=1 Tax=Actinoplanes couchii TaxID=403638 RepID=A0ABQ3XST8_9ACTN|nr:hypothetical protein [Actinoplanes couchii]MDR6324037.1 hypothetical protein [Actinoplanes couchii]GID61564.1 hypothetical protein Aco03nite_099680 [Actinoplanes couchii]
MANASGTPLTRFGSRVPHPTAHGGRSSTSTGNRSAKPAPTTQATVAPTIRTMVVCVPDTLPSEAIASGQLGEHLKVRGTLLPRFWTTAGLLQRIKLFGFRAGKPAYCAGGPVRLLNLDGMRQAAGFAAGVRHQLWQQAIHGTRPAHSWPVYLRRHLSEPDRYPRQQAEDDFRRQPRVLAVELHNINRPPAEAFDLAELDMYQAGPAAYQHYSAAAAVTGDAVLTRDGNLLAPASDTAPDRVTFLNQASHYLHGVTPQQRLLALSL